MTANVKKCAIIVVFKEEKVNPIINSWEWGEEELPVVDQYAYHGVDISKYCSWDTFIANVVEKGKSQVGKIDAIRTDSHLDTRFFRRCIPMNMIVPKLEYTGEV